MISICGALIRKEIIKNVNFSDGFSILADESTDIAGIEQLSLGVRFVDKKKLPERRIIEILWAKDFECRWNCYDNFKLLSI